ncbi:MAG: nuclear transport factor 2 family protein [Pseudomonadota bacterium]
MPVDDPPVALVRRALEAFSRRDFRAAFSLLHPACVWTLRAAETGFPFGGTARGRNAIARRWKMLDQSFEYLLFRPLGALGADGGDYIVRARCEVVLKHRESGETFFRTARMFFEVHDMLIVRVEEYYDTAKLQAFMALFDRPSTDATAGRGGGGKGGNRLAHDVPPGAVQTPSNPDDAPERVAERVLERWSVGDIEGTLDCFADDCVYVMHIDEAVMPSAGPAVGLDEIVERLNSLQEMFEYLTYQPGKPQVNGDIVRVRCYVSVRSKTTAQTYEGSLRLVMKIQDGKIVEMDEFHDAPAIEAYQRLAARGDGAADDGAPD